MRSRHVGILVGLVALVLGAAVAPAAVAAGGATVGDVTAMVVDHAGGRVYWANSKTNTIAFASLDGSSDGILNTSGATVANATGLAVDPGAGRLYWVNRQSSHAIGWARLDGSGGGELAAPAANLRYGLAIGDGKLWWTVNDSSVAFMGLDGSNPGTFLPGPSNIRYMAFDPVGDRVYWTTYVHTSSSTLAFGLGSSKPDGTDVRPLSAPGATMSTISGLALDPSARRIYWWNNGAAGGAGAIGVANLDGSGGHDLLPNVEARSEAIAVDPTDGRVYWSDFYNDTIVSMKPDGSDSLRFSPLGAPIIRDRPPPSTPLTTASLRFIAQDQTGVTLWCQLDGGAQVACGEPVSYGGHVAYSGLKPGRHCVAVRERGARGFGPATTVCWTVTTLAVGCTAGFHHGYFITASSARLARRTVIFHATTASEAGKIALSTSSKIRGLRVAYRLDGQLVGSRAKATLQFIALDATRPHTLTIELQAGRHRARITRHFRYVSYVSIACGGRRVVGRIATRTVHLGGVRITVSAQVPKEIRGTAKLRFLVAAKPSGALRAVNFSFAGKALHQHALSAALTAQQLAANGSQTMTVELVPVHGHAVTLHIPFRTRST